MDGKDTQAILEYKYFIHFRLKNNYLLFILFFTISIAKNKACLIDCSEAVFFPAMLYAVPWSGDVLTKFKPDVKFTPSSKANALNGINPWS